MDSTETLPPENIYGHTKKLRYILNVLETQHSNRPTKRLRVLDFGCGNGSAVSKYLITEWISYLGVETHAHSLEHAISSYSGPFAEFLGHVPSDRQFDAIIYADVLEHLVNPLGILMQHRSLLVDQGVIVGSVPNGFGPFENEKRLDRIFKLFKAKEKLGKIIRSVTGGETLAPANNKEPYNFESRHLQFFTQRSFSALLNKAGYCTSGFSKGAFLGAWISELFHLRAPIVNKLNARVSDFLPFWAVSTWYWTAKKNRS